MTQTNCYWLLTSTDHLYAICRHQSLADHHKTKKTPCCWVFLLHPTIKTRQSRGHLPCGTTARHLPSPRLRQRGPGLLDFWGGEPTLLGKLTIFNGLPMENLWQMLVFELPGDRLPGGKSIIPSDYRCCSRHIHHGDQRYDVTELYRLLLRTPHTNELFGH